MNAPLTLAYAARLQGEAAIREQRRPLWLAQRKHTHTSPPVGLPDVYGFLVYVLVSQGLLIQEVKKVFNRRRDGGVRTKHTAKEIIHELLQRSLKTHATRVQWLEISVPLEEQA